MRPTKLALIAAGMLLCSLTAEAWCGDASQVYVDQFRSLHKQVVEFAGRVSSGKRSASALDEQLALLRLVHRLEESAMESANGDDGSTRTLLVCQAANGLGFELSALGNFLTSGDRSFGGFARRGEEVVLEIERHM